jgi:hypothetical protein
VKNEIAGCAKIGKNSIPFFHLPTSLAERENYFSSHAKTDAKVQRKNR